MKKNSAMKKIMSIFMIATMVLLSITNGSSKKVEAATSSKELSANYLNLTEKNLYLGDKETNTFDFDIRKDAQKKGATYYWYIRKDTGNPKAVVINKVTGLVTAQKAGTAYIRCKVTLENGTVLRPEAKVTVINNITEVDISNISKNMQVKAGKAFNFNKTVVNTDAGKGKATQGITRWEISNDTAGVESVTEEGIVFPSQAGQFKIRAISFQSKDFYNVWKSDNKANADYITAASKWYDVTVKTAMEAIVNNQEQLDKVLTQADFTNITISTKKAMLFSIPDGDYSEKTLVVNIPNSDVENNGVFKSISIEAIKDNTWIEYANGNIVYLSDDMASFVIEEGAEVKRIVIDTPNSIISFEIRGMVEQIIMEQPAQINLSGDSTNIPITVEAAAKGSTIVASIPLELTLEASVEVILNTGAENTTLDKNSSNVEVRLDNQTEQSLVITTNNTDGVTVDTGTSNYIKEIETDAPTPVLSVTPTPVPTASPVPTSTPLINNPNQPPVQTPTQSPPLTPSPIPSPTPSPTSSPTPSPTSSPTSTPSPSLSPTPSPSPSLTPTPSPSTSPTPTPDTVLPVITLNGGTVFYLDGSHQYLDQGIVATDDIDGDITHKIIISGDYVDISKVGTYEIIYTVSDAAGNMTSAQRTIYVQDQMAPEVTLLGDPIIFLTTGTPFVEPGIEAIDNFDGNISNNVIRLNIEDNLDTSVARNHRILYSVKDSSGNESVVKRVVVVYSSTMTVAPVILVLGGDTHYQPEGMEYVDAGVIAWDLEDGDITEDVVIGGDPIDITQEGYYVTTYNVTDSNGNAAEQGIRQIDIYDEDNPVNHIPPTMVLAVGRDIDINIGNDFVDPGVFAWDDVDGDISDQVIITGAVDINTPGSYELVYNICDSDGNYATELRRNVHVRDLTPPAMQLIGNPIVFLETGDPYVDLGVTATDNVDGDVTDEIEVYGATFDTGIAGDHLIYYIVLDAAGNKNAISRIVVVSQPDSSVKPVILLMGHERYELRLGTEFIDPGVIASDSEDGVITDQVIKGGDTIDITKQGIYTITYNVTDLDGNKAVQRTRDIVVYDPTKPRDMIPPYIGLINGHFYIQPLGEPYVEPGFFATDIPDIDLTSKVVITGTVDVNTIGDYTIYYNVMDDAGNSAQQVTRIVSVKDLEGPVITLSGGPVIFLTQGEYYEELGTTAIDNVDGDISYKVNWIHFTGSTILGHFIIPCYVNDNSGNGTYAYRHFIISEPEASVAPFILMDVPDIHLIQIGKEYKEPVVSAYDDKDGNITDQIVNTGDTVDSNIEGIYNMLYEVTDTDGNLTSKILKVVVTDLSNPIDYAAPVISFSDNTSLEFIVGSTYILSEAIAIDDRDGDVSSKVQVEGTVDWNTPGTYEIKYTVSDATGNEASVTRIIKIMLPPTFELAGDRVVFLWVTEDYIELGVNQIDELGQSSPAAFTITGGVNTSVTGKYTIFYTVNNIVGVPVSLKRDVVVSYLWDEISPVVVLNGEEQYTINIGDTFTDPGAYAVDDEPGILVAVGDTDNSKVYDTLGTFQITYHAIDRDYNFGIATRTIIVVDPNNIPDINRPLITLKGSSYMIVQKGEVFNDPGVIATDDVDGNITGNVKITGTVDTTQAGLYRISYTVRDASDKKAIPIVREVLVKDPIGPTLALNGPPIIFVNNGSSYMDPGAIAYNGLNENISSSIIVGGDFVDNSVVGTYVTTYNVMNSNMVSANEIKRVVVAVSGSSIVAPYILLMGDDSMVIPLGENYTEPGYYACDNIIGDITGYVQVAGIVDTSIAGTYFVIYSVFNWDGSRMNQVMRQVIVV